MDLSNLEQSCRDVVLGGEMIHGTTRQNAPSQHCSAFYSELLTALTVLSALPSSAAAEERQARALQTMAEKTHVCVRSLD